MRNAEHFMVIEFKGWESVHALLLTLYKVRNNIPLNLLPERCP